MKSIAAIFLMFAAASSAPAQEKSNQLSPSIRLYEPKNMGTARAMQVAQFVTSVLSAGQFPQSSPSLGAGGTLTTRPAPVQVSWDDAPHALVIRGGSPADQDAAEALLRRFDIPETGLPSDNTLSASRFEITAYLIRAVAGEPVVATAPGSAQLASVPKDLQSAIDEMKQTFAYRDYRLWDVVTTQAGGGTVELSGILPLNPSGAPDSYSMAFQRSRVSDDKTITLEGFVFVLKQPWGKEPLESRIAHTVSLHVGQKLVLGKIRLRPTENADLFLILTARLK
jgi:hypothetical protein